jgi:hypothetical protein
MLMAGLPRFFVATFAFIVNAKPFLLRNKFDALKQTHTDSDRLNTLLL